jgi:two-component system CheB/CheR fusion protein
MARAYALVLDKKWTAMPIATVVGQALTAFKERCVLAGPEIALKPECGLSISMVVHELATNAAKYGALSKVKGRVEVTWSIENECLVLAWRESGGPKVAKPASRGFGLTMIEGEIAHTLAGTSEVHFEPDGLVVRLSLPLEGATAKG